MKLQLLSFFRLVIFLVPYPFMSCLNEKQIGEEKSYIQRIMETKGLVALWDFKENEGEIRKAYGLRDFPLKEQNGTLPRVNEGPLSGYSILFGNKAYLSLSNSETKELNIYGPSQGLTVISWVKWKGGIGFVGGMWNEGDSGGKRQYGLFVDISHYNGPSNVCGHISFNGKKTPPFPASIDYSASKGVIKKNVWECIAMTYDGKYAKSFLNGVFEERPAELINNTKGYPGYPNGIVASKNPYYFPYGLGNNGSDFTIGAVALTGRIGNYFNGQIGGVVVFNRVLSNEEIFKLSK